MTERPAVVRRPSGDRPPLPREFTRADRMLIVFAALVFFILVVMAASDTVDSGLAVRESVIPEAAEGLRSPVLVDIAQRLTISPGVLQLLSVTLVVVLVALRRIRRMVVAVAAILINEFVIGISLFLTQRPRPLGVEIIGEWSGYAFPSAPLASLAVILFGFCFGLFSHGPKRQAAAIASVLILILVHAAGILLGSEFLSSGLASVAFAGATSIALFRSFVPDGVFPIRGGNAAHLDLGGRRGEAIRSALKAQLGLAVAEIEPFGLSGSAGSTPMRVRLEDGRALFAKLYAISHLRSDRWYKFGRALVYGRLEDEKPFGTVRRIVQYEDYVLRVMRDAGIPVVDTYGIVELTPEREYLLVTGFVENATEFSEVGEVDDNIIREVLAIVRSLWNAGLAHRDIKPSNLLLGDGKVYLIDVAFAEIRPSPWRQAVDLANAMILLALHAPPERVYEIALEFFSPEEIAEGFAATKGVTVPAQLRKAIRGRKLIDKFRSLAPTRPPIPVQHWSFRRVGLLILTLLVSLVSLALLGDAILRENLMEVTPPECSGATSLVLAAQAVQEAESVPCVESLPTGWEVTRTTVESSTGMVVEFRHDRLGERALVAHFFSCSPGSAGQLRSGGCFQLDYSPTSDGRPEFSSISRDQLEAITGFDLKS